MIVNKATIQAAFISIKTLFNKAFSEHNPKWQKVAMRVPSTTYQEDYAWLSKFPKMRRWIGEKHIKALKAFKYSIVNADFEATVEVDRNHIEDDRLGIYEPQAKAAGQSAKEWPDDLVTEAMNNGFTKKCFDGQYFYDTDHPVGPEGREISVSNRGTAPLSNANRAGADASFGTAFTTMRAYKDDEGHSLKVRPNVLAVGVGLELTAKELMTEKKLADDTPNPYRGMAEYVVLEDLNDKEWHLLDTSKPIRPFVFQERKKPVFVSQTDLSSDDVFNRRHLKFGAEARGEGGYAFWQLAYGSTGQG